MNEITLTNTLQNQKHEFLVFSHSDVDGLLLCWYFIIVSLTTEAE